MFESAGVGVVCPSPSMSMVFPRPCMSVLSTMMVMVFARGDIAEVLRLRDCKGEGSQDSKEPDFGDHEDRRVRWKDKLLGENFDEKANVRCAFREVVALTGNS